MAGEVRQQERQELAKVRPAADILQQDDSYAILLDMPGVSREDLSISVDKDVLTVEATTSYPSMTDKRLVENEFGNVHYIRKFTLSDAVDKQSIKAHFKNGLVKLQLPKAEALQPKKIQIEAE
jgi:HSP20 family molecular chaperone IbpA